MTDQTGHRTFAHWAPAGWLRAALALLMLTLLATGCQTRFPSEQIPKMKLLVMPFSQPPGMRDSPLLVRGWWFTARTIRQNPRAGAMLSETLMRQFAKLDFLNLYSNIDLKYYFADKHKALKEKFGHLTDAQIDELMEQVPSLDYARELGADKVLSGRILTHYMGQHNVIPWWWSTLQVDVQLADVASGKVEWQKTYHLTKQLASQLTVQEALADRISADLKREYFGPMVKK